MKQKYPKMTPLRDTPRKQYRAKFTIPGEERRFLVTTHMTRFIVYYRDCYKEGNKWAHYNSITSRIQWDFDISRGLLVRDDNWIDAIPTELYTIRRSA